MNRVLAILLSIFISAPMLAQPHKKGDDAPFKEKIEATKVAYFTEKIGLTPEEAQVFWPTYNKWWSEKQVAHKELHKSLKAIEDLEAKGNYTAPQMKKLINEYSKNLSMESEIFDMYIEEFYKILPIEKVAKIFVAEKGFRDILTKMWREKKHPKKGAGDPVRRDPSQKPE